MRHRFGFANRARLLPSLGAVSILAAIVAPTCTQTAVANGDTRTIHLFHVHTKETIDATYRVNGQYDEAVLKQLNWFLRDWRRDEPTNMDPRLFDVVWEVYRAAGAGNEPVTVMSAYRSPETNAMLRRRSRAVAEYSQHMLGKAMDTSMPGMSMEQIREVGMRLQRGGVGYYPTAGTPFVHLDVGSVRSWPRMPYDQLARLFPDGKTVHLPSNGQPLARYEEARAEIAAGGALAPPSTRSSGFFAWLFGGSSGRDGGDDEDSVQAAAPRVQTAGRRGRGTQVATAAAQAPASSGPDDGGRDFFVGQASRAGGAASASAPQPPTAAAQEPDLPPNDASDRTAVASLPASATDRDLAPVQEGPSSAFLDHPPPPRRPADLLALEEMPLPPARPVELASYSSVKAVPSSTVAYASTDLGLRRDPISSLLDRAPAPPVRPGTAAGAAKSRAGVATIGPVTGLRAAHALAGSSEPAAPIVPARLDRSNFRAMTGQLPAARMTTQTVSGPTLTASRSSAKAEGAMLSPGAGRAASSFGARATDLSSTDFVPGPRASGFAAR